MLKFLKLVFHDYRIQQTEKRQRLLYRITSDITDSEPWTATRPSCGVHFINVLSIKSTKFKLRHKKKHHNFKYIIQTDLANMRLH